MGCKGPAAVIRAADAISTVPNLQPALSDLIYTLRLVPKTEFDG
jgi:hypothetical protein